jgi:uncharacterized protein YcbK (DUF882 family)
MGDISTHFNRSEYACKCGCGFDAVDKELNSIQEKTRDKFGPIHNNCACRCLEHNRSIGSKDTSQHIKGMAVDFYINGVELQEIKDYVETLLIDRGGIGIYDTFIHIDVRQKKARWDHRNDS